MGGDPRRWQWEYELDYPNFPPGGKVGWIENRPL
jgi:hypothetical protein